MKRPIKAIYVTSHFERQYRKLPRSVQIVAEKKERIFRSDAFDPRLGTHKLKGKLRGLWAFSVTRDIRILFEFLNGDEVLFHDIGPHSAVYGGREREGETMQRHGIAAVGLIAVLAIALGGCGFFTKTGLETVSRNKGFQPQSVERGDEGKGMETDDWYAKVAQQAPAFGGLFLDEQDSSILYVYVTDLSQEEAVKKAIKEVFGPRWLELHMYPQEIRVLQGQYSFLQLKQWRDCLPSLAAIPGVVSLGIDMEKNRLHIGVDKNNKMKHRVVEAVEAALNRLGIPREAVILEFEEPPVLK